MNEKNFEYLKDQVKFTGFGQDLEAALKENLAKTQSEFRLVHSTQYGKDELSVSLHFKKSGQSDMYFFHSYLASLKKDNQKEAVKQTFYINQQAGNITQKEAYNLLDGRAINKDLVNKEGNLYNAWLQLDFKETAANGNFKFKQFSENYGFDLEKSLSKLPIQELADEKDKIRLLESLGRGNRQAVTLSHNESDQKVFIQAAPQFKAVIAYDQNQRRLTLDRPRQAEKESSPQQLSEKNQAAKQQPKVAADEQDGPSKRTGKRI